MPEELAAQPRDAFAIASLTALDKATIALAAVTGLLALIALLQLRAFRKSEARRTQPVAVAHLFTPRDEFSKYKVYLTNEGVGAAFNARFGVRLDGTEYAVGGGRGHRYLVRAGGRVPDKDYLEVEVSVAPFGLGKRGPDVDKRAIFWARYENAFGHVYETANPADPLLDFNVYRSRRWLQAWREARQARQRERDEKVLERRIREELDVKGDLSKLPWHRKIARRFGR